MNAARRIFLVLALSLCLSAEGFTQTVPGTRVIGKGASTALAPSGLQKSNVFLVHGGYAAAGVALRNRGWGTIEMRGVPAGATIEAAYLYFTLLADSDPIQPIVDSQGQLFILQRDGQLFYLNASTYPITRLGSAASPCWAPRYSFSYRLDLTDIVLSGDHNYTLGVNDQFGLPTGQNNGTDPWTGSTAPMAEGATLVVIYSSPGLPLNQVVLHDGNFLYSGGNGADTSMAVYAQPSSSTLRTTFIGADGQALANGPDSAVNGTSIGRPWDGQDPQGNIPRAANYSRGNLWDTITAESITMPRRTGSVTASLLNGSSDCAVWVAQVLSVQQVDQDGCDASFFRGNDTNVDEGQDDRGLPEPVCRGSLNGHVFYGGRLGTYNPSGVWSCCIQEDHGRRDCMDPLPGITELTCQFDITQARGARSSGTYAYWGTMGPGTCGASSCPMTTACADNPTLAALNVPGVSAANQFYARFGACQADELNRQIQRYSGIVGGNVLFADVEELENWLTCSSPTDAACDQNRAVLLGFLHWARSLGKTPGVYTRSNFWFGHFEPTLDRRYPWDPGIEFVFWAAGGPYTSCDQDFHRAMTHFPTTVIGAMKPVVWQYVERAQNCINDYNILTQDPRYGLQPDRGWHPGQVVFSRRVD